MKIALTGATGFLGRRLVAALARRDCAVRALIRRDPAGFDASGTVAWVKGDLSDTPALNRLVEGAEVIVHAAAAVRGLTHADFDLPNRAGTEAVIRAAQRSAAPGARFIHMSSLAARAGHLSHYAGTKAAAEQVVRDGAQGLNWVILRPPAVYGPGDTATLPFFQAVRRGFAPRISGPRRPFSLIHVDDLTAAILHLAETDVSGDAVEIDDGHRPGYGLDDLYGFIAPAIGRRRPVPLVVPAPLIALAAQVNAAMCRISGRQPVFTPGKVRELTAPDWVCAGRRLDEITAWRPALPAAEGIPATARWYIDRGWL